jgi:hypothetical protein
MMRWFSTLPVLSLMALVAGTAQAQPAAPPPPAAPPATYSSELAAMPSPATGGTYAQAPAENAHVGLFVNSLGVLQFGLSPTFEYGSNASFNARALFFNTGALSYVTAGDDTLHFTVGAGPGFRYYFGSNGNLRGGYIGGFGLYLPEEEQYKDQTLYKSTFFVLSGEGGYRWVFHSGFLVGVGAMAGVAVLVDKSVQALNEYGADTNDAHTQPFGMLTLDLGFLI